MNVYENEDFINLLIYDQKCDQEILLRNDNEIHVDNGLLSITKASFRLVSLLIFFTKNYILKLDIKLS